MSLKSEIFGKTNEVFNSSILIKLREEISTVKKEITQSIQNAKEASPDPVVQHQIMPHYNCSVDNGHLDRITITITTKHL